MSVQFYDRPNMYIGYKTGTGLTAWRNGDAALASIYGMDDLLDSDIGNPLPQEEEKYPVGISRDGVVLIEKAMSIGDFKSNHLGQSGFLQYWVLGNCVTTGTGPYVHTMSFGTSQVPINLGLHVEKEKASQDRRYDLFGLAATEHHWKCPDGGSVEQDIAIKVAFAKKSGCTDIANPNSNGKFPASTFTWTDLKAGGITFNYGGSTFGVEVVDVNCGIYNKDPLFSNWDSTKHASNCIMKRAYYDCVLKVKPYNADFYNVNGLYFSGYTAGELDLTLKWQRDTNDYVQYTYQNMRMKPVNEKIPGESPWIDEYEITLLPSGTSTFGFVSSDSYDKTRYEND